MPSTVSRNVQGILSLPELNRHARDLTVRGRSYIVHDACASSGSFRRSGKHSTVSNKTSSASRLLSFASTRGRVCHSGLPHQLTSALGYAREPDRRMTLGARPLVHGRSVRPQRGSPIFGPLP